MIQPVQSADVIQVVAWTQSRDYVITARNPDQLIFIRWARYPVCSLAAVQVVCKQGTRSIDSKRKCTKSEMMKSISKMEMQSATMGFNTLPLSEFIINADNGSAVSWNKVKLQ